MYSSSSNHLVFCYRPLYGRFVDYHLGLNGWHISGLGTLSGWRPGAGIFDSCCHERIDLRREPPTYHRVRPHIDTRGHGARRNYKPNDHGLAKLARGQQSCRSPVKLRRMCQVTRPSTIDQIHLCEVNEKPLYGRPGTVRSYRWPPHFRRPKATF